ncbi:hypothetical protein AMTRI_Chr01g136790 [Amborella trichopoda]
MGGFASCIRIPIPISIRPAQKADYARVIHLNGFVEDFPAPTPTVIQITGPAPKHFLCSSARLRALNSDPLPLTTHLNPGELYFLLPLSAFQCGASPIDLAALTARLGVKASRSRRPHTISSPVSPLRLQKSPTSCGGSPKSDIGMPSTLMQQVMSRERSWRPVLESIEERSFGRKGSS